MKQAASRWLIEAIRRGFRGLGIDVHRIQDKKGPDGADIFKALVSLRNQSAMRKPNDEEGEFLEFCARRLVESHSQILQDLFVLWHTGSKRQGYFVEFGATDGLSISNTVLLERNYGWKGVVAEPARHWKEQLLANRECTISTDCVWHTSGELLAFRETKDRELSTIEEIHAADRHQGSRDGGVTYMVPTVSLLDLLERSGAPKVVDYLSIDTEGSEYEILKGFDFGKYEIGAITVEHNHTPNRDRIYQLLARNGFARKFDGLSQWDDWYVRE